MEIESLAKAINALTVFIQDMSDDLYNVKGQLNSLQGCFKNKILQTREPLAEDWARAQLSEFDHKLKCYINATDDCTVEIDFRVSKLEKDIKELTLMFNNLIQGGDDGCPKCAEEEVKA